MTISVSVKDHVHYVDVAGTMTIYQVAEHKEAVNSMAWDHAKIVFNLEMVDEIDSAGVQMLMVMAKEARKINSYSIEIKHSPETEDAIKLFNISEYLTWKNTNHGNSDSEVLQ